MHGVQQIAYALKQAELGTPIPEVCRKMGISDATFYSWRKKFAGLGPSELKRPMRQGSCRLMISEGWQDNHKRIYRLYQGLSLRLKRHRRNKAAKNRQPVQAAAYPNQIWAMDFVSDALFDGRRLRMLTIIDLFTRECLGIVTGQSLKGDDVKEALTRIARFRGAPQMLKSDNGSEFAGKVMDRWAYEHGIGIDFSRPGKPTDNAAVESFNGRFRQECLNEHWFLSLADAQRKIEQWRMDYNVSARKSTLLPQEH